MKTGKITAKLRDAVIVRLYEEGKEMGHYKNIELPDELKELETKDFAFDVAMDGKITFIIHYEPGILPEIFPEPRGKMTRAERAAAKAAKAEEAAANADEETTNDTPSAEDIGEPAEATETPPIPETRFNVTGEQRKALVAAIGTFAGIDPVYKAAPTFAYVVGEYTIDKAGTLTGEASPELLAALAEQGFTPDESNAA